MRTLLRRAPHRLTSKRYSERLRAPCVAGRALIDWERRAGRMLSRPPARASAAGDRRQFSRRARAGNGAGRPRPDAAGLARRVTSVATARRTSKRINERVALDDTTSPTAAGGAQLASPPANASRPRSDLVRRRHVRAVVFARRVDWLVAGSASAGTPTRPTCSTAVCVITNIELEHTAVLGGRARRSQPKKPASSSPVTLVTSRGARQAAIGRARRLGVRAAPERVDAAAPRSAPTRLGAWCSAGRATRGRPAALRGELLDDETVARAARPSSS